ncbi:MAG: hypothetical protein LBD54_01425 [Puniceicoccales bacterium]|jgi:hypothetical protein|nr:hypothetical protein [Puniceicoccales bacterium]
MPALQRFPIRIAALIDSFDQPQDVYRRMAPQFWRGNDLEFQIGILRDNQPIDISNLSAIHLAIKALNADGTAPSGQQPNLMAGHDTTPQNIGLSDWKNGSQQHATIRFSAEESALPAGHYWLSIWATTQDAPEKVLTLTAGHIRVLENGGLSLAAPEPQALYYDAETCDARYLLKDDDVTSLIDTEALRSSLELGTLAEQDADAVSISGHVDITSGSITQISDLSIADGGTGASTATEAFQNLSPLTTKGDLLSSNGSSHGQRLAVGTEGQLLCAQSAADQGLAWVTRPGQLLAQQNISASTSSVDFLQVFDGAKFHHYKLYVQHNTRSPVGSQMQLLLGASSLGTTPWLGTAADYRWQTYDIRGKTVRTESTADVGEFPYFPLGNSSESYRAGDGFLHLNIDIWNDGIAGHAVAVAAIAHYLWVSETNHDSGMGYYWGTYLNSGDDVVDSLRFQSASGGNISGGSYSLYGIE